MAKQFWTPRRRKAGFITFVAGAGLLVLLVVTINSILTPIIARKIKNAVMKSSDSLYRISFGKLELNIFTGKAVLTDIRLTADTNRRQLPAQVYSGSAKQLVVTGAHPFHYWFGRKLEISQITLTEPDVTAAVYKIPPASAKKQTIFQKISKSLKLVHVQEIDLQNAKLTYQDRTGPDAAAYHLKELSLTATDLLIDSATQRDSSRTLFCRDVTAGIRNFSGTLADGTYRYRMRSGRFSTKTQKLTVNGVSIQPLPAPEFFARTKADRFTFDLDSLVLDHFNYRTFMLSHSLEVKKMSAWNGRFGVAGNPKGVLPKTDRIITFPNYIIRTLATHFILDTLDIAGLEISYSQFNQQPGKWGTLSFRDTKARFLNITNQPDKLVINKLCRAQLSTRFMGSGKLDVSFVFNLADRVYAYRYTGHLSAMPLTAINPVLMPFALARIKSGQLKSMDFRIQGDRKISTGSLGLLYNDLDAELLNSDYSDKVIKSFLANALIIKKDNPDQGSAAPRFAKIVYIRPKNYPFFKTLWKTLLSGIKPCAGVGYAVTPELGKPLSKKEQKAAAKALKQAAKAKKQADRQYQEQLKKQAAKSN